MATRGPVGPIRDDGRCPTAECFNTGTKATHHGLCAECFVKLNKEQRAALREHDGWLPPDHPIQHVYTSVPTPRMRVAVALGALAGAVTGAAAAWAILNFQ